MRERGGVCGCEREDEVPLAAGQSAAAWRPAGTGRPCTHVPDSAAAPLTPADPVQHKTDPMQQKTDPVQHTADPVQHKTDPVQH